SGWCFFRKIKITHNTIKTSAAKTRRSTRLRPTKGPANQIRASRTRRASPVQTMKFFSSAMELRLAFYRPASLSAGSSSFLGGLSSLSNGSSLVALHSKQKSSAQWRGQKPRLQSEAARRHSGQAQREPESSLQQQGLDSAKAGTL